MANKLTAKSCPGEQPHGKLPSAIPAPGTSRSSWGLNLTSCYEVPRRRTNCQVLRGTKRPLPFLSSSLLISSLLKPLAQTQQQAGYSGRSSLPAGFHHDPRGYLGTYVPLGSGVQRQQQQPQQQQQQQQGKDRTSPMALQPNSVRRPAVEWLSDLQRAKADGNGGIKPRTTIQDLLERINDPNAPETALIPTSPRSIEACFRMGIDPVELQFHPVDFFRRAGEDDDIAQLRYEKNEGVRQDRMRSLIETRKMLVDENWGEASSKNGGRNRDEEQEANKMVEEERRRLEVSKRRGEKELNQMIQHELRRKELLDKQQRKIDELDRRAADMVKQKEENEAAWITKQREIELQKLRAEQELELEAKRIAEERFKHERAMQQKAEEEERQRKREAFQREMERRKKTEDARRETQAILDAQAEAVRQNKLEMDRRDVERIKRMQLESRERQIANEEKRKKADQRIQSALTMNEQMLAKKRSDYEAREAANEARRKELEEFRRREEIAKREDEKRKEKERHDKYLAALEGEEARKMSIKARAEEKERVLAELYARRKKENDIKKVESEFELKLRLDKVDALQKTSLYQRHQNLEKIMGEYEKTRTIMRERNELQRRRKMANMQAAMQRQAMAQAMEQLKRTKDMNKLTGPGGSVNVSELLNKSRPATAAF